MVRPNINIKRRFFSSKKGRLSRNKASQLEKPVLIISAVFLGVLTASLVFLLVKKNFGVKVAQNTQVEATSSGEVLGTEELPTPTPTGTPAPTPTPTPTSNPTTSSPSSGGSASAPISTPSYSGPPLSPAPSQKTLLALNFEPDSGVGGGWTIAENGGVPIPEGKEGQALSFSDGNKLALSGGEIFANAGTLSFWLKVLSSTSNGEAPLLDWNFDGGDYAPSLFEVSIVDTRLLFSIYDETGNQDDISGERGSAFEWRYVVVAWDLTKEPYERVLYIDGKKIASGGFPFAPTTNNSSVFQIGGKLGGRSPVSFVIDEIVLTNWAKSEEEMAANH